MATINTLIQEINRNYRTYTQAYGAIPKPKPQKPKLKLPSIQKKYQNLEQLLEGKMSAYDLREIFEAIFNSDHPMLVEPLEHLITIAKLSLNIDLTTSRISVQSSKDWYQRRQDQYVEKLDKWFAEKKSISDNYETSTETLRISWKNLIDTIEKKFNGQIVNNLTIDETLLVEKLLLDKYLEKSENGMYSLLKIKELSKRNFDYINEIRHYIHQRKNPTQTSKPITKKKK